MLTIGNKRPTWAEINLDNLAFNIASIRRFIGTEIECLAVIKADAYGHGACQSAKRLEEEGVEWFGVAILEEALELREYGISRPILCIGGAWNGQEESFIESKITPVIYRHEHAERFNRAAENKNVKVKVHIKIDTGMGRIGVRFNEFRSFFKVIKELPNIEIEGLMTHFAAADDLQQYDFTALQMQRFAEIEDYVESEGIFPRYRDLANSPGAIAYKSARHNLVRLGGIIYGLGGDVLPRNIEKPAIKPVLSLHTRIANLKIVPQGETLGYSRTFQTARNSLIATVPIGYHDGYPRALSNIGRVIIRNQLAPVVGRISMDWTIIDVTDIAGVEVNDEVKLIGSGGDLEITAEELAALSGTISYEITCGINRRVWRKYVDG